MKLKEQNQQRIALALLVLGISFGIIILSTFMAGIILIIAIGTGNIFENTDPKILIAIMGSVSILLAIIFTLILLKIILRPVNHLMNQMDQLAEGNYKARVNFGKPIGAHPTFIHVSKSFNKMAQELENTEMLRSDFINNFSHEFKTPIVSIAGFAKLLKFGNLSQEQNYEYASIIEEESLRLSAMANNVLTLTKCENQTILTDITTYNLSEQIRNSILSLEGKWAKRNIDFVLNFDEYMINANRDLLKNVWMNLIDNAIKFSKDGGRVEIEVQQDKENTVVSISNYGAKITPEQQARIFNKFYQADESHSTEGNGIGLSLVKGVVNLHGGEVYVESDNMKTTFTVRLPQN